MTKQFKIAISLLKLKIKIVKWERSTLEDV